MTIGVKTNLSGWGRFRHADCRVIEPENRARLTTFLRDRAASGVIARGMGRSYGDSSVLRDGLVIGQKYLNRLLSFDPVHGSIHCEAGVTLEDIIKVSLPYGWFLPTTPGTKYISVGGAIAADVHGKNHHADGTFGAWVRGLTLILHDGTILDCSSDKNADVFWATIGGMGLTGFIRDARIQLTKVESAYYSVRYHRCANLNSVLSLLASTENEYKYSVGWIDCLSRGSGLGRSILMLANNAGLDDLNSSQRNNPLEVRASTPVLEVPFDFPNWVLNPFSVSIFNKAYYLMQRNRQAIVSYESFFYPLDGVSGWNRIYGKRGFVQYQALFPEKTAEAGIRAVLETVSSHGAASFLAVIKRCGEANPAPLSYLHRGYTIALDIPNFGNALLPMIKSLDEILLRNQGRLYLAKDSMMDAGTFASMYPRKDEFLAVKRKVDPDCFFRSDQAKRVGLCF